MNRRICYALLTCGAFGFAWGLLMPATARAEPVLLAGSEAYPTWVPTPIACYQGETGDYMGDFVPASAGGLGTGLNMATGPDGNVYVCDHYASRILRYSRVTGEPFPGPLGAPGTAEFVPEQPDGPIAPGGIVFGPDHHLYVGAQFPTSVERYDGATGEHIDTFIRGAPFTPLEGVPLGLRFGPDGDLYVAATGSNDVQRYDGQTGEFLGVFAGPDDGLVGPRTLIFHEVSGETVLLVLSGPYFSVEVRAFRFPSGESLGVFVPAGTGGLAEVLGGAIGPDGHLYLADWGQDAPGAGLGILRFDGETGDLMDVFAAPRPSGGHPMGILFTDIPEPRDRSRFVSVPNVGGSEVALRVTLTTLYDETLCPPRTGDLSDLSAFDGEVRWLGQPQRYAEGTVPPQQDFLASPLQCCPHFRTWSTSGLRAGFPGASVKQVFAFGPEVVPCSTYRIDAVDVSCPDLSDEGCYTEVATVHTSGWGDVEDPMGLVNFVDINALVACFKSIYLPDGWNKTRCTLRGNLPAPDQAVNFVDINFGVEGYKSIPYREAGPTSCGPCE